MTTQELVQHLNTTFAFNPWPKTYTVDADTYANVCHTIFNNSYIHPVAVSIGPNGGIMFKNVELILNNKC